MPYRQNPRLEFAVRLQYYRNPPSQAPIEITNSSLHMQHFSKIYISAVLSLVDGESSEVIYPTRLEIKSFTYGFHAMGHRIRRSLMVEPRWFPYNHRASYLCV